MCINEIDIVSSISGGELRKLVIVHRKVAEGAEGYLFLLFAERPKSKKTHPADSSNPGPRALCTSIAAPMILLLN